MKNIKIDIKEPMRDGSVGIRSAYIEEAIKKGVELESTTPEGTVTVDPKVGRDQSRIMKMEGNYPGNPMILYVGWINDVREQKRKKVTTTKVTTIVIEEVQTKLF